MLTVETIYALATSIGGAIAIIRVSGPDSLRALQCITGKDFTNRPRQLLPVAFSYAGEHLDDGMAVYFTGPGSYTGEDMVEFHCHGSPAVVRGVMAALADLGMRDADPGEFTRRAFINGKMDLTQAEAVMDLIDSEATLSARAALLQMQGRLSREILQVETLLTEALSGLTAAIDYPEELEEDVYGGLPAQLQEAARLLTGLISQGEAGRVLREGFRVVLLGAPNAGKSSLLNALLGWERAIVTPLPGTTRDTLEELLQLSGLPVLLVDTAGLRDATDEAEHEGVRRAKEAALTADLALLLLDGTLPLETAELALLEETKARKRILVRTKLDLPAAWEDIPAALLQPGEEILPISTLNFAGMNALHEAIVQAAGPVGGAYITNRRHVRALKAADAAVVQARALLREDAERNADSIATDLREALVALGGITGKAVDEDVLERVFERFCVGK